MLFVMRRPDKVCVGEFMREDIPKKGELVKLYNIIFGDERKAKVFKKMKKREIKKYYDYKRGQNVIGWSDGEVVLIIVK